MNAPTSFQFAMLGWSEIVFIVLALGSMAVVGVAIIVIAIKLSRRPTITPPPIPPVMQPETDHCQRCGTALGPGIVQGLCPKCVLAAGFETQTATEPAGDTRRDPAQVPPVAELNQHFPQLEILELLGRGGMGWVYKARQKNLDRFVALKVLPPGVGSDPAFAERFQREARALARLNHPNIVAIYDFGQAGPYFFFVMEFVDGANLRQLERSRRLSPEEAFAIVPKICEALQFAHDEGIVHRDIKPENILVDSKGRVKIADFGIAKLIGRKEDITLTGTQHTLGTPHYMAPEQLETPTKVDHRADIYALGVVFYEMLTGELPMGRFEPPSKRVLVDIRVDEVVLRSLERSPERRYQTVSAVKTEVENLRSTDVASGLFAGDMMAVGKEAPVDSTAAIQALRGPAIGLLVVSLFNWIAALASYPDGMPWSPLIAVAGLVTFVGALRMKQAANHGWAWAAAVIGMLTPPGFMIGLPVGIWTLVVLLRPEVKAAFRTRAAMRQAHSAAPGAPSADAGVLSLLGRVWQDWWSERAKWFALTVQLVLVVLHLACLFAFIGTGIKSQWESGGHRQFTYTLGAGEPWFKFETYPAANTPFRSGFHPTSSSMLFLIAGFLLYYVIWRIEKVRKPKAGFWSTPAAMGILWAIFAIAAVGMGTKMGFDALKEDTLGGLLAPQLRGALEIRDAGDRDEALRQVTLVAAGAMDMKTVTHALREIRDGELHDQTAADSALALSKLLNGASNAVEIAGLIRLNSLRDDTLGRIASDLPSAAPGETTLPANQGQMKRPDADAR